MVKKGCKRTDQQYPPAIERFNARIDKNHPSGCWIWLGKITGTYGTMWIDGRVQVVHRWYFGYVRGYPIPKGMEACHSCDNRLCVNPEHIFEGTHQQNMLDSAKKQRGENLLTPDQVREIRREQETRKELARKFGVAYETICACIKRRTYAWVE